jgi:hypothetical protein
VTEHRPGLIRQRRREILLHRNFLTSLGVGIISFLSLAFLRLPNRHTQIKISELCSSLLTFTSMGFAVSTTAVALILAMPLGRATALMVVNANNAPPVQVVEVDGKLKARRGKGNIIGTLKGESARTGYLELISVFLITAFANVLSSAGVILWAIIAGGDELLTSHSIENSILAGIVALLVTYSGMQMLTAVTTLYKIAVLIQNVMRASLFDE